MYMQSGCVTYISIVVLSSYLCCICKSCHCFKVRVKLCILEILDFDLDYDIESTPNFET